MFYCTLTGSYRPGREVDRHCCCVSEEQQRCQTGKEAAGQEGRNLCPQSGVFRVCEIRGSDSTTKNNLWKGPRVVSDTSILQECIPVGCVPPAAVAVSPATHAPPPPHHARPWPHMTPCYAHPLSHAYPPVTHAPPLSHACSPTTHPPLDKQTPVKT